MAEYTIAGVCYNKYEAPLAKKLKDAIDEWGTQRIFEQQWYIADDDNPDEETFTRVPGTVRDWTAERFKDTDAIIYICPVVRAVRYVGRLLADQQSDPAVIAIDPNGRYCIPVLSGRRGEAYEIARIFDTKLGISFINEVAPHDKTQFDILKYARNHDMVVSNIDYVKEIAAAIHAGDEVGFYTKYPVVGELPGGMVQKEEGELGVYISHSYHDVFFRHTLWLIPRCITIGVKCTKDVPYRKLEKFVSEILKDYSIFSEAILRVAAIEDSASMEEIKRLGTEYGRQVLVISKESAERYREIKNTYMDDTELAALKSGGDLTFVKALEDDGMVCSIALKDYYIKF